MNFSPNRTARGLVTGKLGNMGVLVPDITNPFFAPILAGVEEIAQRHDIGVFLADTREDLKAEARLIQRLSQQVDGLVLVASRLDEDELRNMQIEKPTVLVNRVVSGFSSVAIDARQGMADLLDHLADLGHRNIAYLDGPAQSSLGYSKRQGLSQRASERDVNLVVSEHLDPSFAAGRSAAGMVMKLNVSAVVAFDDLIAWGLITRLQELEKIVPDLLSVAGFDDAIQEGMLRPALTTVSPHGRLLGKRAMELLSRRMSAPDCPPSVEMLPCSLRKRQSTARARQL